MKNFSKVVEAGKKRDISLLPKLGTFCIIDFKQGHYGLTAAGQLAQEGDFKGAEFLMEYGANIIYVAYGAAMGGHREYAEVLLGRGTCITYVAQGAAFGGHREYAETLLARGASINDLAQGAAMGGHREYAETLLARGASINALARGAAMGGHQQYAEVLLGRGANINSVAYGAALTGHQEYAEVLLGRGADINYVAQGAARGRLLSSEQLQLRYLSKLLGNKRRKQFFQAVNQLQNSGLIVHPNVLRAANRIVNLLETTPTFSYRTAEVICASKTNINKQEKSQWGALVFFAAVLLPQTENNTPAIERVRISENGEELPPLPRLAPELWFKIFEYVFSSAFRGEDIEQIGFATQKIMLMGVLSDYRNSLWTLFQGSKKDAANAILSQVNETIDGESLTNALHTSEVVGASSNNPALFRIQQDWSKRFPQENNLIIEKLAASFAGEKSALLIGAGASLTAGILVFKLAATAIAPAGFALIALAVALALATLVIHCCKSASLSTDEDSASVPTPAPVSALA